MKKNVSFMFLAKWLRSPLTVASVVPSSPHLARAMSACLPDGDGLVIELGGGTGPITQALSQHVRDPRDLVVVERDQHFYEYLHTRFPEHTVICGDAAELASLLTRFAADKPVKAIVSGLPLLSMSSLLQRQILEQAMAVCADQGCFIQFSYGLTSPLKKGIQNDLGLHVRSAGQVWFNVPPARVWVYERLPSAALLTEVVPLIKKQTASVDLSG